MNCDVCNENFLDTMSGLVELTFHKIVKHGTRMNEPIEDSDKYIKMVGGSRAK